MLCTGGARYRRSEAALSRRSFDSFVVASAFQPGLVLLEGLLARAWAHLDRPMLASELDQRLGLADGTLASSPEVTLVLEHLGQLGLLQSDDDSLEFV